MLSNIPIGVIGDKDHLGAPTIKGFGGYKEGGYTGPMSGARKGFSFSYKGFGRGWGFTPDANSYSSSNLGSVRSSGAIGRRPYSIPETQKKDYSKEVQDNLAKMGKVLSSFKIKINSLLQNNIDSNKVKEGLTILDTLRDNPDSYLKTDVTYNTNLEQMAGALTKELSAKGLNPAESGFGASTLQEETGRFRNEYISSLQNKILGAVSFSGDVQRGIAGLSTIGDVGKGQTDNIPGMANTLNELYGNKISTAKNNINLANSVLVGAVSRGK